jgi:flagellar protein FlaF
MDPKIGAYQRAAQTRVDFRQQEAEVFKRVTYALIQGKAKGDGLSLIRAASDNKLLWLNVITVVNDDQNQLPPTLRSLLASLGEAVIREIDANITGKLDVDFLVNVNNQIIEGLLASPAAQPVPQANVSEESRVIVG